MRPLIALLPVALVLATLAGCDKAKQPASQATGQPPATPIAGKIDRSHAGQAEPAVPFLGPDGGPATLATWRGKPLLVNLWATWCAPCVKEMPALDALAAAQGGPQVVAVSQDIAGKREVDPFFAKAGIRTLKPYLDKQNVLMAALKVDTLPITIFYDAQGKEVWRVVGDIDWTGAAAKALIAQSVKS